MMAGKIQKLSSTTRNQEAASQATALKLKGIQEAGAKATAVKLSSITRNQEAAAQATAVKVKGIQEAGAKATAVKLKGIQEASAKATAVKFSSITRNQEAAAQATAVKLKGIQEAGAKATAVKLKGIQEAGAKATAVKLSSITRNQEAAAKATAVKLKGIQEATAVKLSSTIRNQEAAAQATVVKHKGIQEAAAEATAVKLKGLTKSINHSRIIPNNTKEQSSNKNQNPPPPPRATYPAKYVSENQGGSSNTTVTNTRPPHERYKPNPPSLPASMSVPGTQSGSVSDQIGPYIMGDRNEMNDEKQEHSRRKPNPPTPYKSESVFGVQDYPIEVGATTECTPPERYKPKPASHPASVSDPGTQSGFVAGQNGPFAMGDWNRRNEEKQQHLRKNPIPLYSSESVFGVQGHPTEVGGTPNRKSNAAFLGELERNTLKRFSHQELKKFTLGFADRVGRGGFGSVYRGKFLNGTEMVVKVLEENDFIEETFEAEVSTMFKTSHRYLVKCYGYCFDVNLKAIVYEYMENGSLDGLLYGNPRNFEWKLFYIIAIKTAKGLSYLHDGCDFQIIHHDLKPANVLVDKNLSVKITDFGVARIMNANMNHVTWTKLRGTPGFLAPEMSMPGSEITYKCDVYSFGVMLFEILGMRSSGGGLDWFPKHVWSKFENDELDQLIDECGIQEEYRLRAKVLSMVALWCIQFTPQARPSMSTVVKMLEGEVQVKKPPNPFYPAPESSCSTSSTSSSLDK